MRIIAHFPLRAQAELSLASFASGPDAKAVPEVDAGKVSLELPKSDRSYCCNFPQLPMPIPVNSSGDWCRADPAIRPSENRFLQERAPRSGRISHVESNSLRRNDVYRLQAL